MASSAIWLRHPKTGYVVLVTHEDTRVRCLSEGWTLAPDPHAPTSIPELALDSVPDPELALDSAPAPAAAPADALAQPSVAGHLDDMSVIGDSPEELARALEATAVTTATVAQVRERNTAARAAFGIETPQPPPPVAPVKPAKPGQPRGGSRYAG